jgi:hypothetical protein
MNTREYAARIRAHADELDCLPTFEVPNYFSESHKTLSYFYSKDDFVEAVRALGSGTKEIKDDKMLFRPSGASFALEIERSVVCKVVKPAEWSCEPWLTDEQQVIVDKASAEASEDGIPF